MDSSRSLLVVLLALDGVQAAAGVAALVHGRLRAGRGERALARYSFRHAGLLLAGAAVLAIPLVLGLSDVIGARAALWAAVAAELGGVLVARAALGRLHAAAHGA